MCYKCEVCEHVCRPGQTMRKHVISRSVPVRRSVAGEVSNGLREEIAREVPVCAQCERAIAEGHSLGELRRTALAVKALKMKNPPPAKPKPPKGLIGSIFAPRIQVQVRGAAEVKTEQVKPKQKTKVPALPIKVVPLPPTFATALPPSKKRKEDKK